MVAAVYFTLLARSLGVSGYGAFAGVCAMAGILAPFSSLGTGNLLIQAVARDRTEFARRWANCLWVTSISGVVLTALALAVARSALPRSLPLSLVLCIAIADLIFVRLIDVCAMAFQAIEYLRMTAWLSFVLALSRMLAAAALLVVAPHASPLQWSALYLVSTMAPAGAALFMVTRQLGLPSRESASTTRREFFQGLNFAISMSAQTIYNDIEPTSIREQAVPHRDGAKPG